MAVIRCLLTGSVIVLTLLFPLAVYVSREWLNPGYGYLVIGLFMLGVTRVLLAEKSLSLPGGPYGLLLLLTVVLLITVMTQHQPVWLLYYAVVINAGFLGIFSYTLYHPPTMVERIARRQEPDLPAAGVQYTRKVTWLWCGFFLCNGSIAYWTAGYGDAKLWALYNGCIAYVLMGVIVGGELWVRLQVKKALHNG